MDSKVNTLYGLRVCPVSRRVKIEMHPAIELLVKNSAYTVEMINPRILIKEISFLKRINKLSQVNILSKIFTFLNWSKLVLSVLDHARRFRTSRPILSRNPMKGELFVTSLDYLFELFWEKTVFGHVWLTIFSISSGFG